MAGLDMTGNYRGVLSSRFSVLSNPKTAKSGFSENWEPGIDLLSFRFPNPPPSKGAATHARRGLAHSFQQFFQHNRVIVFLVSRRIEKRDSALAFRKMMQLLYGRRTLFAYQLFEIALPEYAPCFRILMEPLP